MSETRQITLIFAATLLLGIAAFVLAIVVPPLLHGDLVVDSYEAKLSDTGTLQEQYIYNVQNSGEYRMLYRSWEAPLVFESRNTTSIQFVSIDAPAGSVGYAKDSSSTVRVAGSSDSSVSDRISRLAEDNEVGIYNPGYFSEGTYTVTTTYVVHPPLETDGTHTHLNLKFAGTSHIPYQYVMITVPAENIEQVYVYPPTLSADKTGDTYTITGSVAENEIIAVEMVGNKDAFASMPGVWSTTTDVASQAASASFWYDLPYMAALVAGYLAKALVLLAPFLLLLLYYR